MTETVLPCPCTPRQILDEDFLECRGRLLEIAAFLDHIDRAAAGEPVRDLRLRAFREAIRMLSTTTYPRVDALLMLLSDPRTGVLDSAERRRGIGAFDLDRAEVV